MGLSLFDIFALAGPYAAVSGGIGFMVWYASRDRAKVFARLERGEASRGKMHQDIEKIGEKVDDITLKVGVMESYLRNQDNGMK